MCKKLHGKLRVLDTKHRTVTVVLAVVVALVVLLVAIQLTLPERSVVAYCKVYKEENAKLANAQGDTYGVAVFSHKSSDPGDFVAAFSRLEKVAPDNIQSDIKSLRQLFEKIDSDPAQALGASIGGISAESQLKIWTESRCGVRL